jgi:hypothetical protein
MDDKALLFVTFGGEYRRSFIASNRKAIARRYGFEDFELSNSEYLEVVPYFFAGWVALQAAQAGFTLTPIRSVRYANFCRYWMKASRVSDDQAKSWLEDVTSADRSGRCWADLHLPRFREVRAEMDRAEQTPLPVL